MISGGKTPATCHPALPSHGGGLCRKCYDQKRKTTHRAQINKSKKEWQRNNPNPKNVENCQAWKQKAGYSQRVREKKLTPARFEAKQKTFAGRCAICGLPEKAIDHNHATGEVRGLLCGSCNTGLGFFRDSPKLLRKAAEYLKTWGNYSPLEEGLENA